MNKLEEIVAHLGAALIQVVPKDDEIIVGHMREAHTLARELLREMREAARKPIDFDFDIVSDHESRRPGQDQ